ncbi:MAG: hypothetical protein GY710_15715 [Desulfobacteraceae bacterium]|nr:hypothetical protein [Desulfobacteraceae bacterium]
MAKEIRTKIVPVRMNKTEHDRLKKMAARAEKTLAEFLRDDAGKRKVRNRKDELKKLATLNRINSNLNMIAKWVNTYRDKADEIQVLQRLISIERAIKDNDL